MEQSKLQKIKEAAYMAMVDFAKSDRAVPNASEIDAVLKRMDATGCKGLAKNMKLELWVIVRDCITFTNREQLDKIEKALLGIIARYGGEKEVKRKSFSLSNEQNAHEYAENKSRALRKAWHKYRYGEINEGDDWENDPVKPSDNFWYAFNAGYTACEQSMWRSADVELPEENQTALCRIDDGEFIVARFGHMDVYNDDAGGLYAVPEWWVENGCETYTLGSEITHWMPIPSLHEREV